MISIRFADGADRYQRRGAGLLQCVALAVAFTLLNSLKPLHIDDSGFYCFASQAADSPLSPYGFEFLWGRLWPALQGLAPPVLPYWWAAGIHLFGDHPMLWKLWLLPFALVLVFALRSLFRRFARGLEAPLLWLAVLSPSLLPSFNLMPDVPALALSLGALALFLRASDRGSVGMALLAGVVAGLAAQTKYTGLVVPALFLLHALLFRRLWLGLIAVAPAVFLFVGWEVFVALRHGQSHLLANMGPHYRPLSEKVLPLFRALLNLTGGLAPATALLGLAALGLSRRTVLVVAAVVVSGCLVGDGRVYRLLGVLLACTVAAVTWRLLRRRKGRSQEEASGGRKPPVGGSQQGAYAPRSPRVRASFPARIYAHLTASPRRIEWFLLGWLALECASYVMMTPFPAARRVLGVIVAATVLVGRLASRTCRSRERILLVRGVTVAGVLLGLVFYVVDLSEAMAAPHAAETTACEVRSRGEGGDVWYVGTWGLKFYAERAGMRPVYPERSRLCAGDWLVVPDEPIPRQQARLDDAPLVLVRRVVVDDAIPLRTVAGYYGGSAPLEPRTEPRIALNLYRVTAAFSP